MWLRVTVLVLASLALLAAGDSTVTAASGSGGQSDPNNCGAAGFRVPAGDICRFGVATPAPAR